LETLVRAAPQQTSLPVAIAATFHHEESVRERALEHIATLDIATAKVVALRLQEDCDEDVVRMAKMLLNGISPFDGQ